jgi:hypothetical protein
MLTIVSAVMVYPAGLVAFIFAPMQIQWVWLGYQLYAMLAMHIYTFNKAERFGTTQEWLATSMSSGGSEGVVFDDGSGNRVVAELRHALVVSSVAEGTREVERVVGEILKEHAQQEGLPLLLRKVHLI